jgi:hypothetical protein
METDKKEVLDLRDFATQQKNEIVSGVAAIFREELAPIKNGLKDIKLQLKEIVDTKSDLREQKH